MKPFCIARRKPEAYAELLNALEDQARKSKDKRRLEAIRGLRTLNRRDPRAQAMLDTIRLMQELENTQREYVQLRKEGRVGVIPFFES